MDIHLALIVTHIIGTVLGVGAATFAEIFLLSYLKDGTMDASESKTLKIIYTVMRFGLALAVLSGFGFLIEYRLEGNAAYLFNEALWAKMVIVLVLVLNAWLLTARVIPLWLGSALSFASWYGALFVGFLIGPTEYGFFYIIAFYVASVFFVAVALWIVRAFLGIRYN
ncbi:MAG: hypothetical protein ACE5F4_02760 [Candidatus Paceibacteria bacterium]